MYRVINFLCVLLLLLASVLTAGEIHNAAQGGDLEALRIIIAENKGSVNAPDSTGSLPLHLAALNGHFDAVRLLVENGATVSAGDGDSTTPLICAAMRGYMDIVSLLLDHGASISERDNFGNTPYLAAAGSGNIDLVTFLLDKGIDINQQDNQGRSALHLAAFRGRTGVIKLLADRGANLQIRDNDSMSVLGGAAYSGQPDAAALLIELGADVNEAPNRHGHTPLFAAIWSNRVNVARVLIESGADLEYRNPHGETALHIAVSRGNQEIAQLLLDAGMNVDVTGSHSDPPLLHAVWGSVETVNWLIDHGAEVNALTDSSSAPLVNAIYSGNADIVRTLISRGAKVNGSGREGNIPLQIAAVQGDEELCAILLDAGANVDIVDLHYGRTPLHWSAIRGQSNLAKLMLEHGADVGARDKAGNSSLYYANRYSNPGIAEILLSKGAEPSESDPSSDRPATFSQAVRDKEAIIWYLGHSGWGIKTQNHFLVFDYYEEEAKPDIPCLANGYIDAAEIKDLNVVVFSTHEHADHYDTAIFKWRDEVPNITYILGHQPAERDGFIYMPPRTVQTVGDLQLRTITATDAGVGFLVNVDGLVIFHAGDHANGVPGLNPAYTDEIDYLAGLGTAIDIAFLPITGCSLGTPETVKEGAYYALDKLKPKIFFPQHSGQAPFQYKEFANDAKQAGYTLKISCADSRGDAFVYENGTIM
ncbi:MAG: ankyrin repeat domain-containing protein [Candidatus Zixiibacteriota bacterium]